MRQRSLTYFLKLKKYRGGLAKLKMSIFLKPRNFYRGQRLRRLKDPKIKRKRALRLLSNRITCLLMTHGKKDVVARRLELLKLFYYTALDNTYYWYSRYPFEHLVRSALCTSSSFIAYHTMKQGSAKSRLIPRFRSFHWGCRFTMRAIASELRAASFKRSLGLLERINFGVEHLLDTECVGLNAPRDERRRLLREARYNRHFRWWRE